MQKVETCLDSEKMLERRLNAKKKKRLHTSGGIIVRKATFETVVPESEIGSKVEYFGMPFTVIMSKDVPATPGSTFPNEAFWASLIDAWVRFHVTGKENLAPWARGPFGNVEFWHCQVPSPVVHPTIDVIAIKAVQLMIFVDVLPIATSPTNLQLEFVLSKF
jgi:hypothetical protein